MSTQEMFRRDDLTLERLTSSRDAGGGVRHSWAQVGEEFKGQLEDASSKDQEIFAQRNIVVTHQVFVLQSDSATVQDGDRLSFEGRKFLVRGIRNRRAKGTIPAFWNVMCEEQKE